jgi:hypothetical protein
MNEMIEDKLKCGDIFEQTRRERNRQTEAVVVNVVKRILHNSGGIPLPAAKL